MSSAAAVDGGTTVMFYFSVDLAKAEPGDTAILHFPEVFTTEYKSYATKLSDSNGSTHEVVNLNIYADHVEIQLSEGWDEDSSSGSLTKRFDPEQFSGARAEGWGQIGLQVDNPRSNDETRTVIFQSRDNDFSYEFTIWPQGTQAATPSLHGYSTWCASDGTFGGPDFDLYESEKVVYSVSDLAFDQEIILTATARDGYRFLSKSFSETLDEQWNLSENGRVATASYFVESPTCIAEKSTEKKSDNGDVKNKVSGAGKNPSSDKLDESPEQASGRPPRETGPTISADAGEAAGARSVEPVQISSGNPTDYSNWPIISGIVLLMSGLMLLPSILRRSRL